MFNERPDGKAFPSGPRTQHCDYSWWQRPPDGCPHWFLQILLGLRAAFSTVDLTLLHRLQGSVGPTSTALTWLQSYLTVRVVVVTIGDCGSWAHQLTGALPEISVLGPILFLQSVGHIIAPHLLGVIPRSHPQPTRCLHPPQCLRRPKLGWQTTLSYWTAAKEKSSWSALLNNPW